MLLFFQPFIQSHKFDWDPKNQGGVYPTKPGETSEDGSSVEGAGMAGRAVDSYWSKIHKIISDELIHSTRNAVR